MLCDVPLCVSWCASLAGLTPALGYLSQRQAPPAPGGPAEWVLHRRRSAAWPASRLIQLSCVLESLIGHPATRAPRGQRCARGRAARRAVRSARLGEGAGEGEGGARVLGSSARATRKGRARPPPETVSPSPWGLPPSLSLARALSLSLARSLSLSRSIAGKGRKTVSYTHLTLPTILRV